MAMVRTFNEGKSCDAVIRRLETREGHRRRDLRSPEQEGHAAPVELICRIGDRLFAFEHTGIEPFAGHVRLEAEAERHFRPIERMLAGRLPTTDDYELQIPVKVTQGLRSRELQRIQTALARWIEPIAPTLPLAPLGHYVTPIKRVTPPGVPFEVSLHRTATGGRPGHFRVTHMVTDLEEARATRLRETCERKFPKLGAWHQNAGAHTVLILEENDIQLTNAQVVFEAFTRVENEFVNKPNEIYLVGTMIDNPWFVHALRVGNRSYYELSQSRQCMTEVDPNTLDDLTSKILTERDT